MRQATNGDTVRVAYVGTFTDGTEFDSTAESGPIEVKIGNGTIDARFESALVGLSPGDKTNVSLDADDAYGPHDPRLVQVVPRAQMPSDVNLAVGGALQASDQQGKTLRLTIVALDDHNVTLDANHPLAGKDVSFELELVEFVA